MPISIVPLVLALVIHPGHPAGTAVPALARQEPVLPIHVGGRADGWRGDAIEWWAAGNLIAHFADDGSTSQALADGSRPRAPPYGVARSGFSRVLAGRLVTA